MLFFQQFPSVTYTLNEGTSGSITRVIPNMTVKLVMDFLDSSSIPFNSYTIQDSDRPDTVASRLYGASRYAWVIMLANNMRDTYDWPLTDLQFYDYMNRKYETSAGANDGYDESKNLVAKYIWITPQNIQVEVDSIFYASLSPNERKTISYYETEYDENDLKRTIRVPSLTAIDAVTSELTRLLAL